MLSLAQYASLRFLGFGQLQGLENQQYTRFSKIPKTSEAIQPNTVSKTNIFHTHSQTEAES